MKTKLFWMLAMCVAVLTGCSDDEKKKTSNSFTYDGVKFDITALIVNKEKLEEGNYYLEFTSDGSDWINIQVSGEWDGKTVDLSEIDNDFDWTWRLAYEVTEDDDFVQVFYDQGNSDGGDIESGELYVKLLDEAKGTFEVKVSATTTDGKKFKLAYKGKAVIEDSSIE